MAFKIHFISGLPRSGSTLLCALLRQNPRMVTGIQSPVAEIILQCIRTMSASESALFISDKQREQVLRSVIEAFYAAAGDSCIIFDNNRNWCSLLPVLAQLFPNSRVICCVRNPAWILDSVERLVQQNAYLASRMFGNDVGNVFSRVELMVKQQFLGAALSGLRQAWFGEEAERLVAVRYDSFVKRPADTMARLYSLIGEVPFRHDFEHVEYEEREFDSRLGMPGLHRVRARVGAEERRTILPPEVFSQHDREFWEMPGQNPRGVEIL